MKRLVSIILLIVVIYVLSETNPTRSEYVDWMNHKAMDQSSNLLQKGVLSVAGKSMFDMGTTQEDYFIFTVYKTDFSKVGMGEVTSVGIFNRFIPISSKE
ncbi:hypothetical protein AA0X95_06785 [Bacillus sp. 1P10SD]|uniref:hypothetical protein n=1 Tax=Bacillus sp. 1P10SD TaxID=3132265 RepID=UPI0039A636BE